MNYDEYTNYLTDRLSELTGVSKERLSRLFPGELEKMYKPYRQPFNWLSIASIYKQKQKQKKNKKGAKKKKCASKK